MCCWASRGSSVNKWNSVRVVPLPVSSMLLEIVRLEESSSRGWAIMLKHCLIYVYCRSMLSLYFSGRFSGALEYYRLRVCQTGGCSITTWYQTDFIITQAIQKWTPSWHTVHFGLWNHLSSVRARRFILWWLDLTSKLKSDLQRSQPQLLTSHIELEIPQRRLVDSRKYQA